jgi:hypothetical protein
VPFTVTCRVALDALSLTVTLVFPALIPLTVIVLLLMLTVAILVFNDVARTVPETFATVTFALALMFIETDEGVTDSAAVTVTDTVLVVRLSLIVMVAEPALTPFTVARPLAYVTVAMELSEEVALTIPEMLVMLMLVEAPTPIVIDVGLTVAAQTLFCKNKTINKKHLNAIALFFIHCPLLVILKKQLMSSEELIKRFLIGCVYLRKNGTDDNKVILELT